MMDKWPTLEGRLNNPITTEEEALRQLKANGHVLTPLAEAKLKSYERKKQTKDKIRRHR